MLLHFTVSLENIFLESDKYRLLGQIFCLGLHFARAQSLQQFHMKRLSMPTVENIKWFCVWLEGLCILLLATAICSENISWVRLEGEEAMKSLSWIQVNNKNLRLESEKKFPKCRYRTMSSTINWLINRSSPQGLWQFLLDHQWVDLLIDNCDETRQPPKNNIRNRTERHQHQNEIYSSLGGLNFLKRNTYGA